MSAPLGPVHLPAPALARRRLGRGLAVAATAGLLAAAAQLPASAAPLDTSADTTIANVGVSSSITLDDLSPSFALNGIPSSTVEGDEAVSYTVNTNNVGGYNVSVQAAADQLVPNNASTDVIPIGNLSVRPAGNGAFTALSSTSPITLHTKASRSDATGDDYSDDYSVDIPFVADAVYSVTLNYVATAL